jgi:hypothetical protein
MIMIMRHWKRKNVIVMAVRRSKFFTLIDGWELYWNVCSTNEVVFIDRPFEIDSSRNHISSVALFTIESLGNLWRLCNASPNQHV